MDDGFRRQLALQYAQERADAAREKPKRAFDEVDRQPYERSRWLGLQIRSLLAIVTVAEEGSFIAAAQRLGYSRSTISHQIAQLEASLGVSLIVRGSGSRTVSVTPAGNVVVAHGRAVLQLLANAENQLNDVAARDRRRRIVPLGWDTGAPPAHT